MTVKGAGDSSLQWNQAYPQGSPTRAQYRRSASESSLLDPKKLSAQAETSQKSDTFATNRLLGPTSIGRYRGKQVAEALISKEESPKAPSSPAKAEGGATTAPSQLSIKKGLGKVHKTIVGFFLTPSPQPEESQKSGPPSPVRTPSPTPKQQQPAASPRTTALKELAKMPSGTPEERHELAKALEALGGENAGALKATDKREQQLGLAELCKELLFNEGERKTVLNQLIVKLNTMGMTSASKSESERAERNAFIGALSKVLGSDTTNELVALAFKNEASVLLESKSQCDQRWRTTTPAVALYAAVVQAEMPALTESGGVIKSCMEAVQGIYLPTEKPLVQEQIKDNISATMGVFDKIVNTLDNTPESIKKLNSSLKEVFHDFYETAKTKNYVNLDVHEHVQQQVVDLLFLRVVNPSIGNAALKMNKQNSGTVITKYLQSAINNDAFNKMSSETGEKQMVNDLHGKMLGLVEAKLMYKQPVASQTPVTGQPSVSKANARPPPPSHDAPPIPQDRAEAKRRFEEMVLKKLNMFTDQIQAASTSAELKEILSRLLIFEGRVATTKNDYCKSEIADIRKLLEAKIEVRQQIEQRKGQISPRDVPSD